MANNTTVCVKCLQEKDNKEFIRYMGDIIPCCRKCRNRKMRKCCKCGTTYYLAMFHRDKTKSLGRDYTCRICNRKLSTHSDKGGELVLRYNVRT